MQSIAWWPTLIVLLIATVTDIRSRRIPNAIVFPFLLAGLIVSGLTGGLAGVGRSLAGIALAAAILGILCYLRGMGMGDLKLCAAVGAWIGPVQLTMALLVTAMAGGVLAAGYALKHKSLGRCLDNAGDLVRHFCKAGVRPHRTLVLENPVSCRMPYAPAIAIGTLFSFFMN